jgi:hypothetical protein
MMNVYEFHGFSSLDVTEYPKSPCAIQGYHIVICNITVVTHNGGCQKKRILYRHRYIT